MLALEDQRASTETPTLALEDRPTPILALEDATEQCLLEMRFGELGEGLRWTSRAYSCIRNEPGAAEALVGYYAVLGEYQLRWETLIRDTLELKDWDPLLEVLELSDWSLRSLRQLAMSGRLGRAMANQVLGRVVDSMGPSEPWRNLSGYVMKACNWWWFRPTPAGTDPRMYLPHLLELPSGYDQGVLGMEQPLEDFFCKNL